MAFAAITLVLTTKDRIDRRYAIAVLARPFGHCDAMRPPVGFYLICALGHCDFPVYAYTKLTVGYTIVSDQQAQTVHDPKTLGKRIKLLRGSLSQEEFAKRVGISRASLANYETGRTIPSKEVIEKIEESSGRISPTVLAGEQLKIVGIEELAEQLGLSDDERLNLTKDEIALIRLARLCDRDTLRDLSSTIVQGFAQNEQSKRLAIDETLLDLALLIEVADGKRCFLSGVQKGNLYAMIEELLLAARSGK